MRMRPVLGVLQLSVFKMNRLVQYSDNGPEVVMRKLRHGRSEVQCDPADHHQRSL